MRQALRVMTASRTDIEDLQFKGAALKCGLVDVCVSLLADEALGSQAAELLHKFASVSEAVLQQTGGGDVRARLRDYLHNSGVGKATWLLARARARHNNYDAHETKTLVTKYHLELIADIYVRNRRLLHDLILEEPCVFEMIVLSCPNECAEKLLVEVGIGKTIPPLILGEYLRLRRLIPLDPKFWGCPELRSLPAVMPALDRDLLFQLDRELCAPPRPPPPTFLEALVARVYVIAGRVWVLTTLSLLAVACHSLLSSGFSCQLTPLLLICSAGTMTLRWVLKFMGAMREAGVATQAAIVCFPVVACNVCGLFVVLVMVVYVGILLKGGLESCDAALILVGKAWMSCIAVILSFSLLASFRRQVRRTCRALGEGRLCSISRILSRARRIADEEGEEISGGGV